MYSEIRNPIPYLERLRIRHVVTTDDTALYQTRLTLLINTKFLYNYDVSMFVKNQNTRDLAISIINTDTARLESIH